MNKRLQDIIKYKTNGRQTAFAALLNWSPQYLSKLLKGVDFGLQPVVSIIEAMPEINARWFLTGQGEMLNDELRSDIRREAVEQAQRMMDFERLVPVMTPEELNQFEKILIGYREAAFSPDTLLSMNERANERVNEINAKIAAAMAKSERVCKQKTVKKS